MIGFSRYNKKLLFKQQIQYLGINPFLEHVSYKNNKQFETLISTFKVLNSSVAVCSQVLMTWKYSRGFPRQTIRSLR